MISNKYGGNVLRIAFEITVMVLLLAGSAGATTQILLDDNFENYTVGTFPAAGGWEPYYNALSDPGNNIITDAQSRDGTKSLQLYGSHYGMWASNAGHIVTFPKEFYIEASMMPSGDVFSSSGHTTDIAMLLVTNFGGSGQNGVGLIQFDKDGNARGAYGVVINNWQPMKWYDFKMKINLDVGTVDYWVNGNYIGQGFSQAIKDNAPNFRYLSLDGGGGKGWFDKIKVYSQNSTQVPAFNPLALMSLAGILGVIAICNISRRER